MLRRSSPAVSFTPSHRALMMRPTRLLLGNDLTLHQRYRAAWDELPFSNFIKSRAATTAWLKKTRYELGLRQDNWRSKCMIISYYVTWMLVYINCYQIAFIAPYMAIYWTVPDYMNRENGNRVSAEHGYQVWCADGKFVRPMYHLVPPMYTMKATDM